MNIGQKQPLRPPDQLLDGMGDVRDTTANHPHPALYVVVLAMFLLAFVAMIALIG